MEESSQFDAGQEGENVFRLFDRLFRAVSLGEIFEAALDGVTAELGCDRAALLLADAAGQFGFVDWRGLSDEYRSAVKGHSPWRQGDTTADLICIEDVRSADFGVLQTAILDEGIAALAFVPLTSAFGIFGKLMIYYDMPHLFSSREKQLALLIARQVGLAIERHRADGITRQLSAIIASSDDAIISKDLNGVIITWNNGATKLFGYNAREAIGQPVTILIPPDRHDEEPDILARIRAGQRIEHYETVRQHKSGQLMDISLSVSPIVDGAGRIIGASKIARDISERRRSQEQQQLLMREMDHRIKNLFTLASSIVRLSARKTEDPGELARVIVDRLDALARAHALTMAPTVAHDTTVPPTTLHALIKAILLPYAEGADGDRIFIRGEDASPAVKVVTPLSLLLHEFATNSAKYGSLSMPSGTLEIDCFRRSDEFVLVWEEHGGPSVVAPAAEGFGSQLIASAARQIGRVDRRFEADGARIEIVLGSDCILETETL